jgi:hypothetical protein
MPLLLDQNNQSSGSGPESISGSDLPYYIGPPFLGKTLIHIRPTGEQHFTSCLIDPGDSIHFKILQVNQRWGKFATVRTHERH